MVGRGHLGSTTFCSRPRNVPVHPQGHRRCSTGAASSTLPGQVDFDAAPRRLALHHIAKDYRSSVYLTITHRMVFLRYPLHLWPALLQDVNEQRPLIPLFPALHLVVQRARRHLEMHTDGFHPSVPTAVAHILGKVVEATWAAKFDFLRREEVVRLTVYLAVDEEEVKTQSIDCR